MLIKTFSSIPSVIKHTALHMQFLLWASCILFHYSDRPREQWLRYLLWQNARICFSWTYKLSHCCPLKHIFYICKMGLSHNQVLFARLIYTALLLATESKAWMEYYFKLCSVSRSSTNAGNICKLILVNIKVFCGTTHCWQTASVS